MIPGLGSSSGEGHGDPLQYSCLENPLQYSWASLVARTVKNLPAMQETRVQSLGREDPLEKEVEAHSNILGLENPRDRRACWVPVHGVAKS